MAASRIFVKGLPPTFDEASFRKHFEQNGRHVTDAKIFPSRRIGYIGYKTPEDAQKAVKYFNKTFIRMSRIGVELARPIDETPPDRRQRQSLSSVDRGVAISSKGAELKRKRSHGEEEKKDDPKLKEFLDLYKAKGKKKAWEADVAVDESFTPRENERPALEESVSIAQAAVAAGASDDEYEHVRKKTKRGSSDIATNTVQLEAEPKAATTDEKWEGFNDDAEAEEPQDSEQTQTAISDQDWARSKTSRLLGLLDDDEEQQTSTIPQMRDSETMDVDDSAVVGPPEPVSKAEPVSSIPTPPADDNVVEQRVDKEIESVRKTMRLFVRNLPYDVQHNELEAEFSTFGNLEEVRRHFPFPYSVT